MKNVMNALTKSPNGADSPARAKINQTTATAASAEPTSWTVVSVEIRREFSLTESDYARVLFFFFLAYSIMYAGSGWLLDKLGTRIGFAVFIAGWSAAQMLHGFAKGLFSLAACRFLLGIA